MRLEMRDIFQVLGLPKKLLQALHQGFPYAIDIEQFFGGGRLQFLDVAKVFGEELGCIFSNISNA